MTAPEDTAAGAYHGVASVRLNGVQIGRVDFVLYIGGASEIAALPATVTMHRNAFASYANEDRDLVIARVQGMETVLKDLSVFIDVMSIRSGENWEPRLLNAITEADIFYLFWCRHAKKSIWVEREWRHALNMRGVGFIDPVPLEPPDHAPPPPELAAKHFSDPMLFFLDNTWHGEAYE